MLESSEKQLRDGCICLLVALIVYGVAYLCLLADGFDFSNSDLTVGFIVFSAIGVLSTWGGISLIKDSIKTKEKEKQLIIQKEEEKLNKFYQKCKFEGITSLSSAINLQKATLIANALEINLDAITIEKLFEETQQKFDTEERLQKEAKIKELRQEEQKQETAYAYYSDFTGRDKRIAMLTDRINAIQEALTSNVSKKIDTLYMASQQKEHNWALAGGLVSGLAGGAAGVATALDLQAQNAEIRAQNQANAASFATVAIAMHEKQNRLLRDREHYQAALIDAKMKLVFDIPETSIMENLTFDNVKVDISKDTGTFKVRAHVTVSDALKETEGRHTVIDGTVYANLIQNGECVGSAKLVLPLNGIRNEDDLIGMCCGSADTSIPYTVEFAPYKLWIMEA